MGLKTNIYLRLVLGTCSWRGNITVDVDGLYEFMTESDDGSYLYIDRQRVVENGGFHGTRTELGAPGHPATHRFPSGCSSETASF